MFIPVIYQVIYLIHTLFFTEILGMPVSHSSALHLSLTQILALMHTLFFNNKELVFTSAWSLQCFSGATEPKPQADSEFQFRFVELTIIIS